MKSHRLAIAVAVGLGVGVLGMAVGRAAAAVSDNFDDNAIGSQWRLITDNASQMTLAEQNQHLQLIANAPTSADTDALYLSNGPAGFRLSTAQDFEITLDYNFSTATGGSFLDALFLDFGVGTDETGANSAAIALGHTAIGPVLAEAHRTGGTQTFDQGPSFVTFSSGTFDISYDAAGDDLTFSAPSGPGTSFTYTLADTVQGVWHADSLLVSFGGRGDGYTTAGDDTYLDNFTLVSGQAIPTPEPASLALLALGGLALLPRRRKLRVTSC